MRSISRSVTVTTETKPIAKRKNDRVKSRFIAPSIPCTKRPPQMRRPVQADDISEYRPINRVCQSNCDHSYFKTPQTFLRGILFRQPLFGEFSLKSLGGCGLIAHGSLPFQFLSTAYCSVLTRQYIKRKPPYCCRGGSASHSEIAQCLSHRHDRLLNREKSPEVRTISCRRIPSAHAEFAGDDVALI